MNTLKLSALLLPLAVAACASRNGPPPQSADAKAEISAAEAVGAQNEPRAALHLKLARDQAAQADALFRDGKDDRARLLLERAKVDAELALVMTRETTARSQVQQEQSKINELERNNE